MEKEKAEYWAEALLDHALESDYVSKGSREVIDREYDVLRTELMHLPVLMPDLDAQLGELRRGEITHDGDADFFSKIRTAIRELLREPTAACPVCKGEQEYTDFGYEQPDMDGSSFWVPGGLACGHAEPSPCENGFSTGPAHDPYGVHCHLDMALHTRVKGGRVHEGHNPLAAPGEEIIMWSGGGYCAGDPLPVRIIGYKPEPERQRSWLENLAR